MKLHIGDTQCKIIFNGDICNLIIQAFETTLENIILMSSEGTLLKDKNGLQLKAKEDK